MPMSSKSDDEDDKPPGFKILDSFPRIMHYYFAAIILCASMSPTTFAVVIAWLAVGMRLFQLIFVLLRKMPLAMVFYIISVACTIFLFCNAMFHS